MPEDLTEAYLKANANRAFICAEFTEVVRNLLRAIGASLDPHSAVDRAADQMQFVVDLLKRADEQITFQDLFSEAAKRLGEIETQSARREDILDVALRGVALIAECSSEDGAAGARVARRERDFLAAVRNLTNSHDSSTWGL